MDILTPPLTQATQSSQANSSIAAAVVASPNCTSQLDECPNMFTKLSSHRVFLTRIASLKELTTGSLVSSNTEPVLDKLWMKTYVAYFSFSYLNHIKKAKKIVLLTILNTYTAGLYQQFIVISTVVLQCVWKIEYLLLIIAMLN